MADLFEQAHSPKLLDLQALTREEAASGAAAHMLRDEAFMPGKANFVEKVSQSTTKNSSGDSGTWRPYLGVSSDSAPGKVLAFDSDFKRLDFGSTASAGALTGDSKLSGTMNGQQLQINSKFSAALVFGVAMKF